MTPKERREKIEKMIDERSERWSRILAEITYFVLVILLFSMAAQWILHKFFIGD